MIRSAFCLAVALAAAASLPGTAARASDKCDAPVLSKSLHERMKQEGKTDAEIRDILNSGLKRRVLRGRVAEGSGCNSGQVDKALDQLAILAKG